MSELPRVEIEYCRQCRWLLRAAWMAQELLTTFESEVGGVTLVPGSGGIFEVRVGGTVIWSRAEQGRFPDIKELKQLVRDRVAPDKALGHSDQGPPLILRSVRPPHRRVRNSQRRRLGLPRLQSRTCQQARCRTDRSSSPPTATGRESLPETTTPPLQLPVQSAPGVHSRRPLMTSTQYGYLTSLVFAVVGAVHVWRVVAGWPVVIGGLAVPMWPSWVAIVVAGALAWEGCRVARRHAAGS